MSSKVISVEELQNLPGVEIGWVFPNGLPSQDTGGILDQGDSYVIGNGRVYPVGTKLGFFLVVKGWVGDGTILQPYRGGIKPYVMFTTDFLNPEAEQMTICRLIRHIVAKSRYCSIALIAMKSSWALRILGVDGCRTVLLGVTKTSMMRYFL